MNPLCPACGQEMCSTANPLIYMCKAKETRVYGNPYKYTDGSICFDSNNQLVLQVYEYPPYKLTIYSSPEKMGTKVDKLFPVHDKLMRMMQGMLEFKTVLTLNFPLSLPWDNPEKVWHKIRTYLVFS